MKKTVSAAATLAALMVVLLVSTVLAAPEIADSAFRRVWERQDKLIQEKQVTDRSWTWGPPITDALNEELLGAPNNERLVQYFEKSRMEINNPNAAQDAWFVTNGLLPKEMMTGKIQTGFVFETEFQQHGSARISAIGDPDNTFPTYADFLQIYQDPNNVQVDPAAINQPITTQFNADGSTSEFTQFANDTTHSAATTLVLDEKGYGVARAFVDFMNQIGYVYENGRPVQGKVFEPLPLAVFGLPITKPYWVMSKVGGTEIPILFQVFERRILTYNPANDLAFRVEMGNVGMHYYKWRYGRDPITDPAPTNTPTQYPAPTTPTSVPTNTPTSAPTNTPTSVPYP